MKAVVTGMIATYGVGGVVWDYGQYLLGLEQLGVEVYYLEDTGWEAFDPGKGLYSSDYTHGAAYLADAMAFLSPSLADRWHLQGMDGDCYGMSRAEAVAVVAEADLFLNVSGAALMRQEYLPSRRKVLIDTDPGWNHFRNYARWDAADSHWQGTAGWRAHDLYFTYAESMGHDGCTLPAMGLDWQPTRPPVVLDSWQREPIADAMWTTVMTWDNFREPIVHGERTYGTKEIEFAKVVDLPARVHARLEVAVGGEGPPVERWRGQGWNVLDSMTVTKTAADYRDYVQRSRGEFSVAKNVYVATGSGWFSCRSACYLAAGLPVVVQDTGFSRWIPSGDGLLAFTTCDEAASALERVEQDYEHHAAAAREVARSHLSSDCVLSSLLERAGLR